MLTFLLNAMAAPESSGTASSGGSMVTTFVTFGLIILIFYFLMIRPQKKRDKETKNMLAAMKKGDKVVSIGGIHGTIVAVRETTIIVKVDDNTRMEFSRNAISQVVDSSKKAAPQGKSTDKKEKGGEKIEKVEAPKEETTAEETEPAEEQNEPDKK